MSLKNQNRMVNGIDPNYEPSHQDLHCLHGYLVFSSGLKGLIVIFLLSFRIMVSVDD